MMERIRAERAFEQAFQCLELELENPGKWGPASHLYYRVRDVALSAAALQGDEGVSGEVEIELVAALTVLRGYTNAHVFAYFNTAPRRPITRAYAAAKSIAASIARARCANAA